MKKSNLFACGLLSVAMCFGFASCSDDDDEANDNSSASTSQEYQSFTELAANSYSDWVYVNLETKATQVLVDYSQWYYVGDETYGEAQASADDITIDWHVAFHRDEVRTNGASVMLTSATSLDAITALPEGTYYEDVEMDYTSCAVIVDMSGMMTGNMGYASSGPINEVLSGAINLSEDDADYAEKSQWGWVSRSGSMGAYVYTPSDYVFVLKFTDGSYAKLLFNDFTSSTGTSGYVSFDYEYVK